MALPKFDFKKIPEGYLEKTEKAGRVELISYEIENCEVPGQIITKYVRVYLPLGYDGDPQRRYNILYMMHGADGDHDRWLGGDEGPSVFVSLLDNMIANGDIEPIIVAAPCVSRGETNFAVSLPIWHDEFLQYVMPTVEGKYRTFAEGDSPDRFKTTREHRAIGGFSLGSSTTWNAFVYNLAVIKYFMPLCGDCWDVSKMGGRIATEETAALLARCAVESGFGKDGYRLFMANGTKDLTYGGMTPQVEAMKKHTEAFDYTEVGYDEGNMTYYVVEGSTHEYEYTYEYFYNGIPFFFK